MSSNIVRVVTSRIKWIACVPCIKVNTNAYRIVGQKPRETDYWRNVYSIYYYKRGLKVWTGFTWVRNLVTLQVP